MKYCSKCGKELFDEAVVCPHCGCSTETKPTPNYVDDEVSGGLCLLAVLIPIFGVIYWIIKHKETPKKAKACGVAGIVSWVVCFVISMIFYASAYSSYFSLLSSLY